MAKVSYEFDLYGKHYVLETGELAKQATGSCLVRCGDSEVLLTVVVSKERKNYDFFPLTVDFNEKMYAVGRIPGGYMKREAKASEKGTLTARMIDRPLRPSFPDGFRNEVQVVATTLVADQVNSVDTICVMGASAALTVGGVPFEGPLACVRIGRDRDTDEYLVNPTYEERDNSDLDLELAGTGDFISMLEAGADEISEEDMLDAMAFGQKAIGEFCEQQKRFFEKVEEVNGPIQQREYVYDQPVPEVHDRIFAHYDEMSAALKDPDKLSRIGKVEDLKASITAEFSEDEQALYEREIPVELKALEKRAMRRMVVETGERVDGRKANEVRPLMVKGNYLPRVHGSGLFQRGQTQVLSVCTLGMLNEWQRLDTIEPVDGKRYIHHYNFPPFCTGETGRMGAPKRREIGHGALAERALRPVIPSEEEFPYTIRVVSEVLESNGSSSMASTCGSTLALMDAGVPIKRPVSGVAMGLIQEEGKTVVLTDIQGLEDFLGDMDFKVTGTTKGITAMQMDNKATGLTPEILHDALMQAHEGRMFILDAMLDAVPAPRATTKETAPRIISMQIPTDKIRDVIGSGGKVIRGIQDDTGATIDIQEDGTVFIAGTGDAGDEAAERIKAIVKVPEVGEEYTGRVVGIQPFGAFVELLPGKDGLLHISRVAKGRVDKVEDVLSIGDEVRVKVLDVDEKGKISLDRLDKPEVPGASERHERHERSDRGNGGKSGNGTTSHRHPGDGGNAGNGGRQPRRRHNA
ncbi:MAG: polyribonucleotide nucleotidyltransferase [Atopobiaceae bacterium]|jgi:polyribonucleotide nucleotidyltransferase|nr:polyribonucleotide nucleotidyltransferase [Atopobiaceae bacterium]MCH4120098.1 polyribonucleotide nucleotidyltransferase [Atopobiaceae bacterium]MCI1388385.1 polyribonucleotide nucleotidyltransferase [Atopobiaceae bacterium]MCI1431364.1 polyribonucleotide nucleotidyltransferase [Atopobiaceae bacterium]MCI1469800.1 polyribonucleotide nucleotidyltransferase [Atopobiaceae bacterium]